MRAVRVGQGIFLLPDTLGGEHTINPERRFACTLEPDSILLSGPVFMRRAGWQCAHMS